MKKFDIVNFLSFCKGESYNEKELESDIKLLVLIVCKKTRFGINPYAHFDDLCGQVFVCFCEVKDSFKDIGEHDCFKKIFTFARRFISQYLRNVGEWSEVDYDNFPRREGVVLETYLEGFVLDNFVIEKLSSFFNSLGDKDFECIPYSIYRVALCSALFEQHYTHEQFQ